EVGAPSLPYTTLFRSDAAVGVPPAGAGPPGGDRADRRVVHDRAQAGPAGPGGAGRRTGRPVHGQGSADGGRRTRARGDPADAGRSEEHTSELQSREKL